MEPMCNSSGQVVRHVVLNLPVLSFDQICVGNVLFKNRMFNVKCLI